jgi:hypothetical protein
MGAFWKKKLSRPLVYFGVIDSFFLGKAKMLLSWRKQVKARAEQKFLENPKNYGLKEQLWYHTSY